MVHEKTTASLFSRRRGLHLLVMIALVFGTALTSRAGEVLHRGIGIEPESLDPQVATGAVEAGIIYDLDEGLLAWSPDGRPAPGVAERWEISGDGTVYTFRLRADAKWSNGELLTAEDFVYSLRRAVDPANAFENAPMLASIVNAAEIVAGRIAADRLAVESIEPRTLKITLVAPYPYFLDALAHNSFAPVHRATLEGFGSDWTKPGHSVTNGAYMMSEWSPQSRIVLTKNPNFWDADHVSIESVVFHRMEATEQFEAFRTGGLDMTDIVPAGKIAWASANLPGELRRGRLLSTYYYVINMAQAPLGQDVRLRKALALAIDRDFLAETVTQGGEIPAYELVPPGAPDYDAERLDFAAMTPAGRKQLALKLMADAGYGPGNPLRLDVLFNAG